MIDLLVNNNEELVIFIGRTRTFIDNLTRDEIIRHFPRYTTVNASTYLTK